MQKLAWGLIGAGTLAVTGWGLWEFLVADDVPLWVRVATAAVVLGVVVMIAVVLRDRLTREHADEFKEVQR